MIKVSEKIEEIIKGDHEALFCLSRGILNLSRYARGIHKLVEQKTKKEVKLPTIIMALSRLKKEIKGVTPLVKEVEIDGMTVKTPLAEIVFEKTSTTISRLPLVQKSIKPKNDEWFSFSQNSKAIAVICSEPRIDTVIKHMGVKPLLVIKDLTAVGLSVDKKYHFRPNITFSLLHKIAEREIPLDQIFTTRDEMMFIFETKYLSQIVEIFQKN
ncbi:MAG: hypothetical protein NTZ87_00470 [Candidatus Nomurabacteria bacterium]|nr:hypothetical protein [Candidatus Nomurabacteria bacterium]